MLFLSHNFCSEFHICSTAVAFEVTYLNFLRAFRFRTTRRISSSNWHMACQILDDIAATIWHILKLQCTSSISAGTPGQTPLVKLTALPRPPSWL